MGEQRRGSRPEDFMCDLNTFYSIIAILEGGIIRTTQGQAVASRIIRTCKAAAGKALTSYDRAKRIEP